MKAIADICVIPITGSISVRQEVKQAHRILAETGLPVKLHGYGTNIEGDLDVILGAVKRIHEDLHAAGCPRISTNLRLGTRTDKDQTIRDKIEAVEGS